ncbi:MAG: rhodanese-like domain-containing protein [Thermoleophilia bacterium]
MHPTITREELARAIDDGGVTVVEALPPMYFQDAHLPGALNLPHDRVRELAAALLPDRGAAIVVYCANLPCQNSGIATRELIAMGYRDVREYAEGKQDWIDAGLPVEAGARAAAA